MDQRRLWVGTIGLQHAVAWDKILIEGFARAWNGLTYGQGAYFGDAHWVCENVGKSWQETSRSLEVVEDDTGKIFSRGQLGNEEKESLWESVNGMAFWSLICFPRGVSFKTAKPCMIQSRSTVITPS